MGAEHRAILHVVDDDALSAVPDLAADRGRDLELAARLQAEVDLVAHGARDPPRVGDSCDGCEAHAGGAAHDFQNFGHRRDA